MTSRTLTIVYTDLSDSSKFTIKVGNAEAHRLKLMHFDLSKALVNNFRGFYVKNFGDGVLAYFDNSTDALRFASALQSICQVYPGLDRLTFQIKIGMAHSDVILDDESIPTDIDGTGANLGSRVQSVSKAGQVVIDDLAYTNICHELGREVADPLVEAFEPSPPLKDYSDIHRLWRFDWRKFNFQEHLTAKLVEEQLSKAHFELTNVTYLSGVPLDTPGRIFWPVSPRGLATAIHRGQLEAIKLISLCGWTTHLFITDSEQLFGNTDPQTIQFEAEIREYASTIGIAIAEVQYLSKIFATDAKDLPDLLSRFNTSALSVTVDDIIKMEGKDYPDGETLVKQRNLLKFLRPTFTTVAFARFLAERPKDKVMVIAGFDERTRWNVILQGQKLQARMNMVFNPQLTKGEKTQLQAEQWPYWLSKEQFIEDMNGTNLADWAFNLFVMLPNFPTSQTICQRYCKPPCGKTIRDCPKIETITDKLATDVKGKCWG